MHSQHLRQDEEKRGRLHHSESKNVWSAEARINALARYRAMTFVQPKSGPGTGIVDMNYQPANLPMDIITFLDGSDLDTWRHAKQMISYYVRPWTLPRQPNMPLALCPVGTAKRLQDYQRKAMNAIRASCEAENLFESIVVDMQKGTGKTALMSCVSRWSNNSIP